MPQHDQIIMGAPHAVQHALPKSDCCLKEPTQHAS
jgi:hypothetical protein